MTVKSSQGQSEINHQVLSKFVDQSVFSHCLKILVLVINSGETENLAAHLNQELVTRLIEWKDDSEIDVKTKNVLTYILKKLQAIKPELFNHQQTD